jgi:hypothetical protein
MPDEISGMGKTHENASLICKKVKYGMVSILLLLVNAKDVVRLSDLKTVTNLVQHMLDINF